MKSNFSDEVLDIINCAKKEMMNLKHPYVGTEHLLLALLKCNSCIASSILDTYGVDYIKFKDEIIKIIGIGSKKSNWYLFTPLLKSVLNNSFNYTRYCKNSVDNKNVGKITEIFWAKANDVIRVNENILIPYVDEFIEKLDKENKKLYVKNVRGLL